MVNGYVGPTAETAEVKSEREQKCVRVCAIRKAGENDHYCYHYHTATTAQRQSNSKYME